MHQVVMKNGSQRVTPRQQGEIQPVAARPARMPFTVSWQFAAGSFWKAQRLCRCFRSSAAQRYVWAQQPLSCIDIKEIQ